MYVYNKLTCINKERSHGYIFTTTLHVTIYIKGKDIKDIINGND